MTKYARNSQTDPAELESQLNLIQDTGVGTDNEEFVDGMVAVSVPIKDNQGRLIACLFCHAPVIRKSLEELLSWTSELQSAASELGRLREDIN